MASSIALLVDDFQSLNTNKWQHAGGGSPNAYENVTSGELVLTCRSAYDAHLESVNAFDLTNSAVAVEITGRPAQGGDNSTEMYFGVNNTVDGTDSATFILTGGGGWVVSLEVNGAEVYGAFGTYSTTNHRWLRLRSWGPKFYFEAGPDGRTWNILGSVAKPAGFDITSVKPHLQVGYYGTQATPGTGKYDNLNLNPYAPNVLVTDLGSIDTTSAVVSVTTTAEYPVGSTIILGVAGRGLSSSVVSSVVDSNGNAYTTRLTSVSNATLIVSSTAPLTTPLAAGSTITFTFAGSGTRLAMTASAVTRLSGAIDLTKLNPANAASNITSATALTTGASAVTADASEFIFGAIQASSGSTPTHTPGAGYATVGDRASATGGGSGTGVRIFCISTVSTSAAAQTASGTSSTATAYRAGLVAFKIKAPGPTDKFFSMF